MRSQLAIKAVGMVTPVGLNAPASLAALRAGIRNVNEANLWDKYSGTYLSAGRVPLPQWWVGIGKLAELVTPAIFECFEAAKPIAPASIPVLLGLSPPDRPFRFPELDQQILAEIQHRLGFRLHRESKVIPRDHVSVAAAICESQELIDAKEAPLVIVAAVDSLIQQDLVEYYLDKRRLLSPIDSNGFCVGEAGAALLIGPSGSHPAPEGQLLAIALGNETATIDSDKPLRGDGMTNVIRQVFDESQLTMQDVHYRLTDLNGEHYRFKELALAINRFSRKPTEKLFDLWHPIEFIGDVGAAIGPVVLGMAFDSARKGYAPGPTVICTFSNDNGERAALTLHYRPNEVH